MHPFICQAWFLSWYFRYYKFNFWWKDDPPLHHDLSVYKSCHLNGALKLKGKSSHFHDASNSFWKKLFTASRLWPYATDACCCWLIGCFALCRRSAQCRGRSAGAGRRSQAAGADPPIPSRVGARTRWDEDYVTVSWCIQLHAMIVIGLHATFPFLIK